MLSKNILYFYFFTSVVVIYGADEKKEHYKKDEEYVAVEVVFKRDGYEDTFEIQKINISKNALNYRVFDEIKIPNDIDTHSKIKRILIVNGNRTDTNNTQAQKHLYQQKVRMTQGVEFNGSLDAADYTTRDGVKPRAFTPYRVEIMVPSYPRIVQQLINRELTGRKISTKKHRGVLQNVVKDGIFESKMYDLPFLVIKYITTQEDIESWEDIKRTRIIGSSVNYTTNTIQANHLTTIKEFAKQVQNLYPEHSVDTWVNGRNCTQMREMLERRLIHQEGVNFDGSINIEDYKNGQRKTYPLMAYVHIIQNNKNL